MSRILDLISECRACPHRRYYSGGAYECTKVAQVLPKSVAMPDWCPLPQHPAGEIEATRRDAARYRFLRTSNLLPDILAHELDAAVDAGIARATSPQPEKPA
jgi:hypothetical protein